MKHLKTYHQHNESIKSNIAKLGLIGSLMLPGTADSKQLPNSINKQLTGIDRLFFQIGFLIWFAFNGWALLWYILLSLLIS